jgi:hypothetical protein
MHDIDGAEREYRASIECDPQHANAHCSLGALLADTHTHDFGGAESASAGTGRRSSATRSLPAPSAAQA